MPKLEWWQNAIIYQICPWSFFDTTGKGIGDLKGIIAKLDYVATLSVDAIWLSPIFTSPMKDLGYDITDMRGVDPLFGSMADFDLLLDLCHARGLKLILDQVWNHTSDRHPWFLESRSSRDNAKANWYVWEDPKEDGSPPNNWLSSFLGESAWAWDEQRQQFYLYNFVKEQPDLNWYNPDLIEAIFERAKFWLDKGVDGFRIDAPNYFLHDRALRDNPPRPADAPLPDGIPPDNPMVRQLFKYNFCRPETIEIIKQIRKFVDRYPGVFTLGETTLAEDSIALSGEYAFGEDRLHLAYSSALLVDEPISAKLMQRILKKVDRHFTHGGNCWMVGNHDYGRMRSRWTGVDAAGNPYPEEFYHLLAALLVSLPGALCLYQGDELGLPEARIPDDIPVERIKDPFGRALYPNVKGRDGSRTPMPWQKEARNAGFTTAKEPWLPIPQAHFDRAVDVQSHDRQSLLNTWRRMLHWQKQQPALRFGTCQILDTKEPILGLIRNCERQRMFCLFNLSEERAKYQLPACCESIEDSGFAVERQGNLVEIPGYSAFFGVLE
ncbi:alpha-amylase family glycosyl hydrolase [Myxosarcina sp. GI1]|uniref:alpha-amylase family glycosyl hydrolase n=1 Tax=Myxosarcina sp. GI1 TaxID=1541065 RepID=UPI0005698058|nr:alpha-amylase family glycosyl hydrolase [Myxosarcina sp. GI1]